MENSTSKNYFKSLTQVAHFVMAFILLVNFNELSAQNITTTVPANITVCLGQETFTASVTNNTGATMQNVSIQIAFPTGIEYVVGSLVETSAFSLAEQNVTNTSNIILSANDLPDGQSIDFSYDALAEYDAIAFQQSGGIFRNTITVTSSEGSNANQTDPFNILAPAISIINVVNESESVFVGQTYTRSFTVINGGYGSLSSFVVKDIYDANLQLNSVDVGTLNGAANEISIGAAEFMTIGNGDAFFDSYEQITITETITAVGCISTQSQLVAEWTCTGNVEASNSSYPYTTITLFAPQLSITPTTSFNTCYDASTAHAQQLSITNNGTGPANDVVLEIYNTVNGNYSTATFTSIDGGNMTYTSSTGGGANSLTPTTTYANNSTGNYTCLPSNPLAKVDLALPAIQPGETITVDWNNYTCDTDYCGNVDLIGWKYDIEYTDMCFLNTYESLDNVGQGEREKNISIFYETPSDMVDGQTETFTFILQSATFNMPEGNNAYFEVVFDIPTGLVWSGNNADLEYVDGVTAWAPSSVNYNAGTQQLVAQYPLPIPFNLTKSEFNLDLTLDCNLTSDGSAAVGMQLFYVMDDTCSPLYRMPLTCYENPLVYLHCPGVCNHGMGFSGFTVERTTFGSPDNDLDGLADGSGSLDMSQVKTNRVMFGDSFETTFSGTVITSGIYPNWTYGYAQSIMPQDAHIDFTSVDVEIIDASTSTTYNCSGVAFSTSSSGGNLIVDFDYSIPTLVASGCAALSGFVFENGDQVNLTANYEVVGNFGGNVEQLTITNAFYLSDIANPVNAANKFQCNNWAGNFTLIGYYYTNWQANTYNVTSCTRTVSQNFYMSIGNCCSNYGGGDLFPYEYRNWSHLKEMRVEIPSGYSIVSMNMGQWRTRYTNATTYESTAINYYSQVGDTYYFDIEQYYVPFGGTINVSDDGFHGSMTFVVEPDCSVATNSADPLSWFFTFQENAFIGGGTSPEIAASSPDYLIYKEADIVITTTKQTEDALNPSVEWDVNIKNNSNQVTGINSWMSIGIPNGNFTIVKVTNTNTSTEVVPVNGIYQFGDLAPGASVPLTIEATYTACSLDGIDIYTGYDCDGYPADLGSASCGYTTFPLYINPQPAELQTIIETTINPNDPCSPLIAVEIEMASVKLGTVMDLLLEMESTGGDIKIQDGSTEVKYPVNGSFSPIADPTNVGNTYSYSAGDFDSDIGTGGLEGIVKPDSNRVRIKFNLELLTGYQSGDLAMFTISGNLTCGTSLPDITLAFDPSAVFKENTTAGLNETGDNWSASWGDYDGDGYVDLFVTTYDETKPNKLYNNNGDGTFTSVSTGVVVTDLASSLAATWGDYDNDGDLDLFVANNIGTANFLYRNEGFGNFTKILGDPIVADLGYSHGASWADYDNDGYLDLFVADYMPSRFNLLYHNNGDGTFSKVGNNPIVNLSTFSVNGVWSDFDNDGDQDLFVSNTNGEDNVLYINNGFGTFTTSNQLQEGGNSVGASWADYNNDGHMDLFVANSSNENNFLYQNNGNGTFTKVTSGVVVTDGGHTHGSAWGDIDNDGDLDLVIANDQDTNNKVYSNNGDGTFTELTNAISTSGGESFGIAWADIENDGDIDLFIANHDGEANFLYENERGLCNSKVCILLEGTNGNTSAIGAKIRLKANIYGVDVWQMREISAQTGGGTGGQNEMKSLFGLGDGTVVDSLVIEWPSGYTQYVTNLTPSNCQTIVEDDGSTVCGVVYNDENGNCIQDGAEAGIPNIRIEADPGNAYAITDEMGNYELNLPPGTYTLTADVPNNWSQSCFTPTASQTVNVAAINQTYCGFDFGFEASCPNPDLNVEVATTALRVGFKSLLALTYTNNGTSAATNVVMDVDFGNSIIPLESTVAWDTNQGTIYSWNFPVIDIGESLTVYVTDSVKADTPIDIELRVDASINGSESDCNTADNQSIMLERTVGAVDPNDITVNPSYKVLPEQKLEYRIRFQNMGNVNARNVRVVCELPAEVDLSDLELGVCSHPYIFYVEDERTLVWEFDNIDLPTEEEDEVGSNGFIFFKSKVKNGVEEGTAFETFADIFFDFNPPIRTNTVENLYVFTLGELGDAETYPLNIYPNPTSQPFTISIPTDLRDIEKLSYYEVYDITGRLITKETVYPTERIVLDIPNIQVGNYFVKAVSINQKTYTGKVMVFK